MGGRTAAGPTGSPGEDQFSAKKAMPEKFLSKVAPLESTQSWRPKLWDAHARYQSAHTRYKKLEASDPSQIRNLEHRLAIARRAESEALADYVRLIKIGTALRAPRKASTRSAASKEGGKTR